jgi:glutathionyl-hydroquinone reductase
MPKRETRWVRVKALAPAEKATIAAACERLITEVLKPRFLPEIRPTQFNYPIDIFGRWRGSKYSFITRYRSGFAENAGEEFDSAFTRLDHLEECLADTRFDVMWHRHTGQWWRLHSSVTLEEALHLIETEPLLQPNP